MVFTHTQACSTTFNLIHTCSKAFRHTQFHLGISSKVHSVAFRLTQRHSCTFKQVQSGSIAFNTRSKVFVHTQAHSIMFSLIQSCSIEYNDVQLHSILFITRSKMFTGTQEHSVVATLTQRHSVWSDKWSPMDMCLNMWSMWKPHRFTLMSIGCSSMFHDYTDLPRDEWRQTSILGRGFGENQIGNKK